jgi:hypothetical protein
MKHLIPVFLILFFFLACKERTPKGIIQKDKMVNVIMDIHLVDGYANSMITDSARIKTPALYQSVYKKYQTDSVQVNKSLEYYSKNPAQLTEMYNRVVKKLENLQKAEQKKINDKSKKEQKARQDSLRRDSLKKKNKYLKKGSKDSVSIDSAKRKELQDALKRKKIMLQPNRKKGQE